MKRFLVSAIVGLAIVCGHEAEAANRLVSVTRGNDANSCSDPIEASNLDWETKLFATIERARQCSAAGDTITILDDGVVLEYIDTATQNWSAATAGLPITIQAFRPHTVILRPANGHEGVALRGSTDYINLINISIDMSLQTTSRCGYLVEGTANENIAERVNIYSSTGDGFCINGTGTGNKVRNQNQSHNNAGRGFYVTAPSTDLQDSIAYSNGGAGIDAAGSGTTVRRNLLYSNLGTYSLRCTAIRCYNNEIRSTLGGIEGLGASVYLDHNTVIGATGTIGIRVNAAATTASVRCNISQGFGTGVSDSGTSSTLTTNLTSGVTFQSTAMNDYTLLPTSSAINACGLTIGSPVTTDRNHVPRSLGTAPDVGAYESPPGCATWADGLPDTTCFVASGDEAGLRLAIYTAACGESIGLEDGGYWTTPDTTPYQIPSKGLACTSYTTIRRFGTLPSVYDVLTNCYQIGPDMAAEQVTRNACWAALKTQYEVGAPRIDMTNAEAILNTGTNFNFQFGASYWKFEGFEVSNSNTQGFGGNASYGLFIAGLGGPFGGDYPISETQVPHHIIFDRMSLHGNRDPTIGNITHALYINAYDVEFKNSLCDSIKAAGDAQCFIQIQGGRILIENNFLEAAGENVLFGGGGPFFRDHTPHDITQRYNYSTKDWRYWEFASRIGETYAGVAWTLKNNNECKNCLRNELYQNVIEGAWLQNQIGNCLLYQSVSDGDGATWSTVRDITLWGNVVRRCAYGMVVGGKGGQNGGAVQGGGFNIHDNLWYGLNGLYGNGTVDGGGTCWYFLSNSTNGTTHPAMDDMWIDHNTCDNESVGVSLGQTGDVFSGFKFTNNILRTVNNFTAIQMTCGCNGIGGGGLTIMDPTASWQVHHNVWAHEDGEWPFPVAAEPAWLEHGASPAATYTLFKAQFVDWAAGNYAISSLSLYKVGGARQASDSKDIGVDTSLLPLGGGVSLPGRVPRLRLRQHVNRAPVDMLFARVRF